MGIIDTIKQPFEELMQMNLRQTISQIVNLGVPTAAGMIVTSALIIWKSLMLITGSESPVRLCPVSFFLMDPASPVVVVLSGSMEPGFQRGDILFLNLGNKPVRTGEIVVFNIKGRDIPIVHRVIKGDNNYGDDRVLYAKGQKWLHREHIMGRAVGYLPYVGMVTIVMNDYPYVKYLLIGVLGLLVVTSKE
eukprot:scaffold122120_cov35-Prasinocladus_malaysianus.AAC.2